MFREKIKVLDANMLRLLAVCFMLLDHMWASVIPGQHWWMTEVGRLAFPIFAFQIAEGYLHTSDYKRYVRRLLIFALLSEIPFNYFFAGSWIFPFHQNVLFTLLLGLLSIRQIDLLFKASARGKGVKHFALLLLWLLLSIITFPDYGIRGVLTIITFFCFRNFPYAWVLQLVSMVILHIITMEGQTIPITFFRYEYYFPIQGFAVLSLFFIWLYNGKKGMRSRVLQYGFYVFYPLHMIVLHLIRSL